MKEWFWGPFRAGRTGGEGVVGDSRPEAGSEEYSGAKLSDLNALTLQGDAALTVILLLRLRTMAQVCYFNSAPPCSFISFAVVDGS